MGRTCFLATLVLSTAASAAAPPVPSPETAAIRSLIEYLGDRDYRVRELAALRLRERLARALPYVRQALGHRNSRVRHRALALLPLLEDAILFAPRRITLSLRNQPLDAVLRALEKSARYELVLQSEATARYPRDEQGVPIMPGYTYGFAGVPYWDVVDRICRDADLSVEYSSRGVLWFSAKDPVESHGGRSGPFRHGGLRWSDPFRGNRDLQGRFTVLAEPRLQILRAGRVRLVAAYDNLHRSMLPRQAPSTAERTEVPTPSWGTQTRQTVPVAFRLERPAEATSLALLRGVLPVEVLAGTRPVVLADQVVAARGASRTVGGLAFRLDEVKDLGKGQWLVKLEVTNREDDSAGWTNRLCDHLRLEDDKGVRHRWRNIGAWHADRRDHAILSVTYGTYAGKHIRPTRLLFEERITRRCDVAFEYRNVPLP